MKPYFNRLILFLFLLIPVSLPAQDNKVQKKADSKKEKRLENQKKGELQGRKRHMALQTREVRKRMKKHNKQVNAQKLHRKRGFIYRLFHRNEH